MKIIEPKVELWEEDNYISHVARCARVCYKKETGDDEKTYKHLVENKHISMLRHSTIYAIIHKDNHIYNWINHTYCNNYAYDIKTVGINIKYDLSISSYLIVINRHFAYEHNRIMTHINEYIVSPKEFVNASETAWKMMRYTFCIDTQISTSRELNRVSPNSISEQSTRYVGFVDKQPIYEYNLHTEQGIIDAYLAGHSISKIDKYSSLNHNKIRKLLVSNNIKIRNTANIVNHNAFKEIDIAEKAYLLGLIESDGNIRKTHNEINITQHKDYYLYVKSIMSYILKDVHETNDKDCKRLYCFSKEVVDDLINIGIVENKTYKQTNEDIDKLINAIPNKFYSSFIRGLFDGDGSIGFYKDKKGYDNLNFCIAVHTEKLKDFIVDVIKKVINKDYVGVSYRNNLYYISLHSKEDIIAFGVYLYNDFKYPFSHPNKTNKYISFLQENNVDINYNFPIANFGDNNFTICPPHWLNKCINPAIIFTYILSIYNSEETYKDLINRHLHRQDARGVLPLDTATRCVYTYSYEEWLNILKLRYYETTGKAHPNARVIAGMIRNELIELGYNVDKDVTIM